MKPRILLTGKNGQVGAELHHFLPLVGEVIGLDRHQLDLSNPGDIRRAIREIRPHLIVNAAAYTAVDKAESDRPMARTLNADAPALMAQEAKKLGAGLVHYSTDYIFDGAKNDPYVEDDPPNPLNVYGETKLEGEKAIREVGVPHLVFRTAWVYGTRGRNFLLTILQLATQHEELRVVCDQVGAPTWCREIARATTEVLKGFAAGDPDVFSLEPASGTYHMTARGGTTWYDFARAILEEVSQLPKGLTWFASATNGSPIVTRRIVPIATAEYPTAARRPAYSVLSNLRLTRTFPVQLSDWRSALRAALRSKE
jgi:dTDP-4-dehydrorhamnose reductase